MPSGQGRMGLLLHFLGAGSGLPPRREHVHAIVLKERSYPVNVRS